MWLFQIYPQSWVESSWVGKVVWLFRKLSLKDGRWFKRLHSQWTRTLSCRGMRQKPSIVKGQSDHDPNERKQTLFELDASQVAQHPWVWWWNWSLIVSYNWFMMPLKKRWLKSGPIGHISLSISNQMDSVGCFEKKIIIFRSFLDTNSISIRGW